MAVVWQQLQIETATFGPFTATSDFTGLMYLHVDDMLMAFDMKAVKNMIEKMQEQVKFGRSRRVTSLPDASVNVKRTA